MSKLITTLGLIVSLLLGILLICLGVILDQSRTGAFDIQYVWITVLFSLGGTLITAVLVALTVEWYSFRKFESIAAKWNHNVGKAALSALLDIDLPNDVTESLVKSFSHLSFICRDFSMTFRFHHQNDSKMKCSVAIQYCLENLQNRATTIPCRHDYLRGFLPDRGASLQCSRFSVTASGGRIISEKKNLSAVVDDTRLFFMQKVKLPAKETRVIDISSEFVIPQPSFATFVSFAAPVMGVRLAVESDKACVNIGITGNPFWLDKLREESRTEQSLVVSYRGIAFGGQGVGLWLFPKG